MSLSFDQHHLGHDTDTIPRRYNHLIRTSTSGGEKGAARERRKDKAAPYPAPSSRMSTAPTSPTDMLPIPLNTLLSVLPGGSSLDGQQQQQQQHAIHFEQPQPQHIEHAGHILHLTPEDYERSRQASGPGMPPPMQVNGEMQYPPPMGELSLHLPPLRLPHEVSPISGPPNGLVQPGMPGHPMHSHEHHQHQQHQHQQQQHHLQATNLPPPTGPAGPQGPQLRLSREPSPITPQVVQAHHNIHEQFQWAAPWHAVG
jgi:hypothetical protein